MTSAELKYELLPLKNLLHHHPVDFKRLLSSNLPTILLSQISGIKREYVEQLELAGIFDTEDFYNAGIGIMQHLNLDEFHYDIMSDKIKQTQERKIRLPKIILDLPNNYALITAFSDANQNHFGLYWRGLRVKYSRSRSDYWNPIKHQFEQMMRKMNHPELIGRVLLDSPPHWLEDVTPLSTYLSHLTFEESLLDIALSWGLPSQVMDDYDGIDQYLMAQIYLMQLAEILKDHWDY